MFWFLCSNILGPKCYNDRTVDHTCPPGSNEEVSGSNDLKSAVASLHQQVALGRGWTVNSCTDVILISLGPPGLDPSFLSIWKGCLNICWPAPWRMRPTVLYSTYTYHGPQSTSMMTSVPPLLKHQSHRAGYSPVAAFPSTVDGDWISSKVRCTIYGYTIPIRYLWLLQLLEQNLSKDP